MLPETAQYRRDSADLVRDLVGAWGSIWPALNMAALDDSFPRWAVAAAVLVGRWRIAVGLLTVDYLRQLTDFPPVPGAPLDPARFAVSMRVTALVAVKMAMSNGLSIPEASALAFGTSSRAASRLVLDAGRDVVTGTAIADPACRGWQRVGSAGSCDFCDELIGRGEIYSEATASFESHDGCRCSAEMAY